MEEKKIISVLVDNHTGVLARVASLFCQRGFNIDSLTVSATTDPEISRITIVAKGNEAQFDQIIKQTAKLVEARKICDIEIDSAICRELLLVKVAADATNRADIREITAIYKAKIMDCSADSMVLELTGQPNKINAFLDILSQYQILEMCRTGITAMERGTANL